MEVLWLRSHGLPHALIAQLAGVSENTMRADFELLVAGGIDKLQAFHFYRPESKLVAHVASLEEYIPLNPPATIKEAQSEIEALTGIKRSETQVAEFLKKYSICVVAKSGSFPPKPIPRPSRLSRTRNRAAFNRSPSGATGGVFHGRGPFCAGPVSRLSLVGIPLFIQAPSGRQRFNVLGCLNAITHELVRVTNDTYITAQTVCTLLQQLAALNLTVPITIFLDNARYQKCAVVHDTAERLNIELCFLPAYSPNLNSIERLWQFVKKQCSYSKYYADFATFKAAIEIV